MIKCDDGMDGELMNEKIKLSKESNYGDDDVVPHFEYMVCVECIHIIYERQFQLNLWEVLSLFFFTGISSLSFRD